jgi:Ca2+-binding RTX toxin-like protein
LVSVALVAATSLVAVAASPARAGVVSAHGSALTFAASPGEANALTVVFSSPIEAKITDRGAQLNASGNCRPVDDHSATCSFPFGPVDLTIRVGDGDDAATISGDVFIPYPALLAGGEGADVLSVRGLAEDEFLHVRLVGGEGDDTLFGGGFPDVLVPGPGNDTVRGGPGPWADDVFEGPGDDLIDGGPGADTPIYEAAPAAIVADLAAMTVSAPGWGRERLVNVEAIHGSRFADLLRGSTTGSGLYGSRGDDRLIGKSANDSLAGGPGDDHLRGNGGSDYFEGDAGADDLRGGSGWDSIYGGPGEDRLIGNRGRDSLYGGAGNDRLLGRDRMRDRLDGETGRDCASFDRRDRIFNIDFSCIPPRSLAGRERRLARHGDHGQNLQPEQPLRALDLYVEVPETRALPGAEALAAAVGSFFSS